MNNITISYRHAATVAYKCKNGKMWYVSVGGESLEAIQESIDYYIKVMKEYEEKGMSWGVA